MRWTSLLTFGLLGLFLLAGCASKVNLEYEKEVTQEAVVEIPLDSFKREQKLAIVVTPSGGAVDFFMFLNADEEAAVANFYANKNDKLLAVGRKVQEETRLEATVPARSPATIQLGSHGKRVKVKLKITNS